MADTMLVDCCTNSGFNLELCESTKGGATRFQGKFQEAEAVNKNKRMYPFDVLDENIERLRESLDDRRLVGELDHPTDSIIHFANASHVITRLWWDGNVLMGEGEILNTPNGKVLKSLINDGVKVGISSRGVGNGKVDEEGILVIGESYKLITFDAVADPSTFAAFQEKIVTKESAVQRIRSMAREQVVQPRRRRATKKTALKNESSRIDTGVSADALIACLGGIVKSTTEEIRSRLN
jgi:hypothetical protein